MSEPSTPEVAPKEIDKNKLEIQTVRVNGIDVNLVSCDHKPSKFPKENPWPIIEKTIKDSSLVFVEYFPFELEAKHKGSPLWEKFAKKAAETSGINSFFSNITEICQKDNKQIAVADIASDATYSLYHHIFRAAVGSALATPLVLTGNLPPENLIFAGQVYAMGMHEAEILGITEMKEIGMYTKNRNAFERWSVDMEDARRLYTARGIEQEAKRRTSEAKFAYIAPHAHVNRVKWYLEHPDDVPTKMKSKIYSISPGLSKSTRIYKPIGNSWQLTSEVNTQT